MGSWQNSNFDSLHSSATGTSGALESGLAADMRIAFCHPDLGLGGAERLVVDAATELAENGHQVDVYTAFHDRRRCFPETVGGTFSVTVAGSWFPRTLAGRLHAFCAYVRCTLAAIWLAWTACRSKQPYDAVFVDQVSAVIPALKLLTSAKVLFYCHYPDFLLASKQGRLHAAYRAPLNWYEQRTTGQADSILVNSSFTKDIFRAAFPRLSAKGIRPQVLHPAIQAPPNATSSPGTAESVLEADLVQFLAHPPVFLSINRFERKKNVALAVRALHELNATQAQIGTKARLVLAGGYDARLAENRQYFGELQQQIEQLGLQGQVRLVQSFTDAQKWELLAACRAVVYTPEGEHFGIVPLEGMASARPVIAVDSGGPRETIMHGQTGLLCAPDPLEFAQAMAKLSDHDIAKRMGEQGRRHVETNFSRRAFGKRLADILQGLVSDHSGQ